MSEEKKENKRKKRFKMSYILIGVIAVGIGIVLYVVLAQKLKHMQEGVWDITLETQLPDADTKTTVQLSQELTRTNPVPNISIPNYECRLQKRRHMFFVIGDSVYWRVYCKGENEFQGSGRSRSENWLVTADRCLQADQGVAEEKVAFRATLTRCNAEMRSNHRQPEGLWLRTAICGVTAP